MMETQSPADIAMKKFIDSIPEKFGRSGWGYCDECKTAPIHAAMNMHVFMLPKEFNYEGKAVCRVCLNKLYLLHNYANKN